MIIATKRLLYSEQSWEDFFSKSTPADMDFVQHVLSSGMRLQSAKYVPTELKTLYSFDLKVEKVMDFLARALESTLITAGAKTRILPALSASAGVCRRKGSVRGLNPPSLHSCPFQGACEPDCPI